MDLTNRAVLVTGGAGFIGSHIVEQLATLARRVRVVDNLSTGTMSNIQSILEKHANVEFVWADITCEASCHKMVADMDLICHQAAVGSVPRSIADPLTSHRTNVDGFVYLLTAAKEAGIKRIVYASSSSVYGTNESLVKIEECTGQPLSPYAVTKYANELYASVFTRAYGLECIGLRYFNVFGPRQNPAGCYAAVVPKFIKAMIANEPVHIYGDGTACRDFTYVANIVRANILALTTLTKGCYGEAFNVGTHCPISIFQLYSLLSQKINSQSPLCYVQSREGDVSRSDASLHKSKSLLGYVPLIDLEMGLQNTVQYFKNENVL